MSEIDVNLIRDEDVLRRMWQQTEDFGRKKEIRAHMYRLREERLRSLYSPDPTPAKGCEFSSSQAHVESFADQTFQSMKSKEVRDAGSPPKEFSYRGQDPNELSNAGWTVESEDRAADDGRTRVHSVNANIEGSYDVEGGRGRFAASDRQRRAVTETEDACGHTRREDTSAASATRDHVERRAADGSQHSSTTSSSTTQHHSQQVSSTVRDAPAILDYDQTHDSNRNETITRTTNTERKLRSDDVISGELISRKIEYPDDRTKVIVETRCLPDGTRVTNTRREFRVPAHTTRSEYQTSSEIKSHSSQLKSDKRETSLKNTRHATAGRIDNNIQDLRRTTDDIVDSQRHVDDNDFKRQLREYSVDDDTASELRRTNRRHETTTKKVTDHSQTNENFSQTHYETNVNNKVTDRSSNTSDVKDDYTQVHQQTSQVSVDNVDQTDRREVYDDSNISCKYIKESHTAKDTRLPDSPRDGERPGPTPDDTSRYNNSYPGPKDNTERVHTKATSENNTNRQVQDTKVEERKIISDRYQTTYQSDFQQKKVSTDWSPTQQAWASSLRADTPPATRSSTRASSPGSKTFKSSTSSLRSSVSPDKYRKPPSRGPSPNKLDRCSPTRFVASDKLSSTQHSTLSINETRTSKHASPERKPPIGRAPGDHNRESERQRLSVSPENRPQNLSSSPDRKQSNKAPTNEYPRNRSPTRTAGIPSGARQTPERRPDTGYPSPSSPQNSRSPEKQLRTDITKSGTNTSPDRRRPIENTKKPEDSPEREFGYRHSTSTTDPINFNKPSVSPDRKPGYMRPTAASQHVLETRRPSKPEDGPETSSDRKHSTSTTVKEDHYKFIDEETKMNTRTDKIYDTPQGKATSPSRKSPSKEDHVLPFSNRRSPSPQKKTVIVNENDELYGRVDKTVELIDTTYTRTENVDTKFGTYDKKKPRNITETTVINNTSTPTKDVTYDTVRPRDKTSPKRGQEPTSPIKKNPKGSTSPTKSPTRDTRFKQTTDFISSERTTEEVNKKTVTKEHPRQLVTPSSSPTRKSKFVEVEPSTGQSSPTTSVSGFIYFGSPREEKPIVTDLDEDFVPGTDISNEPQYPRPESLNLPRSTSPSKIPCRSPSPEKRDSLTKDSLPRKSSLKKPSNFVNPSSPVDKPPTSFRISPVEDEPTLHKVVKKDYPSGPGTTAPTRAKPPLTRRETYEDRCRLILGMMDTNTSECIKETTPKSKKPDSNKSSPSVSPCDSPLHKEASLFSDFSTEDNVVNMKSDVTSFISKEQQEIIQTNRVDKITETNTLQQSPEKKSRSLSTSPERKTGGKPVNNSSPNKLLRPSSSPQRTEHLPVRDSPDKIKPKETSPMRTIKKTTYGETTTTENANSVNKNSLEEFATTTKTRTRVLASPTRQTPKSSPAEQLTKPRHDGSSSRDTQSPQRTCERKPLESSPAKTPQDQYPEPKVPQKSRMSPEKVPGYMKTTTASSIKCDTATTEDIEEVYTLKTVDQKRTKTSVSQTLPIEKSSPRSVSPTKPSHPRNNVPKSDVSTDRNTNKNITAKETLEYTKTSASSTEKEKTMYLKVTDQKQTTSESPKRKSSEPRTPSPTKSTRQLSATTFTKKADTSPDRKPATKEPSSAKKDDVTKKPQSHSPSRKPINNSTELTNASTTVSSEYKTNEHYDITTEDMQKTTTSITGSILYPRKSPIHDSFKPIDKSSHENTRSDSPTKPTEETPKIPEISPKSRPKPANESSDKLIPKTPTEKSTSPSRSSVSPDRKPSYMKSTSSVTSKQDFIIKLDSSTHKPSSTKSCTPRESQERIPKDTHTKPEEPRQLRTPSPSKKQIKVTEVSTELLISEREQEILDRVQKSLRKLSPDRKEKSPSRDMSPKKNTTSLQDLDITTTKSVKLDIEENNYVTTVKESCPEEPKEEIKEMPSKPSSRNTSPVKRTPSVLTSPNVEPSKSLEFPNKSRSISPRKPLSQTDRPQSPRRARASGIRPRDQVPFNRKPTPATLSTYKIDSLTNGVTKQNVVSKTNATTKSTTNRLVSSTKANEPEIKRNATIKGIKENYISPREVTRTSSDSNIKPKKVPQRMKSKPEIQVNDLSTKSPKYQKPIIKEPSKMPVKPKSATALNTPTDNDDDIIIDVLQSKSSRENSPDRICPTPVNLTDDVGTPRFPDEVSEPDDEYRKRTYHTIHETETVVDDIVEICEDEELFVKKSDITSEYDDSLLSVTDKVNKFTTKIDSITKPKEASNIFKINEQRDHSDFINDNLKTDECLLTVSEKVTKFVKGSGETKDIPSKFRKITDEYDNNTIYQDDYTKLSVNDKAHLFVETAENMKVTKAKPAQKVERPDMSYVDESLKKDDCLLSVSDKVNKFVKTAENFITETQEVDQKKRKYKEQHDRKDTDETYESNEQILTVNNSTIDDYDQPKPVKLDTIPGSNLKNSGTSKTKPADRLPTVKITTLRSSEAVKKAKELFENIASTQKKDVSQNTLKTTKLTDIGVVKKSPKTDSTVVLHPFVKDVTPCLTETETENDACPHSPNSYERPSSGSLCTPRVDDKPRASPNRFTANSLEVPRAKTPVRQSKSPAPQSKSPMRQSKSPMRQTVETTTRTVLSRYPVAQNAEPSIDRAKSPMVRPESEKPDKVPGYLRPTKTSQNKEESKVDEDVEVSTRRGSGKFGVELRRTSFERSTASSERRRSVEHHQPCIEDIFELDLLEQMLEKVVGYEQRRRIRSQIRIVKNQSNHVESHKYSKTKHTTSAPRSRVPYQQTTRSPERVPKPATQRVSSPDRPNKTPQKQQPERVELVELIVNGHGKESATSASGSRLRTHSPEKLATKSIRSAKSPIRQSSPVKKRTVSPTKNVSALRANRFNEYTTAYMKKVDSNQTNKVKLVEKKTKKTTDTKQTFSHETQDTTSQEFSTTNSFSIKSERTPSRDVIEIVQMNGKRSPSPEKEAGVQRKPQSPERRVYSPVGKTVSPERRVYSPVSKAPERKVNSPISKISERKPQSPERNLYSQIRKTSESVRRTVSPELKVASPAERLYQRSPSPEFKRQKPDPKKETIIQTVYEIEKKMPNKPVQDVKPSWVMNRNLKKITSETRTFSSKKVESEKPKYVGSSPSMAVCSPTDVITSSYGPGPLDAAGRPLFGIRALRNGATNVHVKGTVIRQEFHSSNGSAPEGSVSVTAYSSQPEELERLLAGQEGAPPSRLHGLAAITTTKKFGGDTGISMSSVNTKEERASLDQFTHTDRKMDSRNESLQSHSFETQENIDDLRRIASTKTDSSDRQERRREERVAEVRKGDKVDRREDKKTLRQSSVKSLTEKFIKSAHDTGKAERGSYPKAGLILRTTSTLRDADAAPPGLGGADSEHSIGSTEDVVVSTSSDRGVTTTTTRTSRHHGPTTTHQRTSTVTHHEPVITKTTTLVRETHEPGVTRTVSCSRGERSFLDSSTKVSGVQDILTRMRNADIVIEDGDTVEDAEARALLNKFLGASVLMAGMQEYVCDQPQPKVHITQESVRSSNGGSHSQSARAEELDLDNCWDEKLLRKHLDECTDYELRRRLRARIRTLMAEQEACAAAVTEALGAAHITTETDGSGGAGTDAREEEEVTETSTVRRDSSEKTTSSSTTKTSKVTQSVSRPAPQQAPQPAPQQAPQPVVSPFAKFRQLEKQNSTNSPSSPGGPGAGGAPQSPGSPQPYFKFTDPALQCSALTIKERLLQWCRDKTRDYENVKLENFSTSWADGLAFCALLHHFLPDAFDYSKLTAATRRHNFTLAFQVADEKAGIYPLLDVDDMVAMRKPDWKCVFTYVQSIYRRFKDEA